MDSGLGWTVAPPDVCLPPPPCCHPVHPAGRTNTRSGWAAQLARDAGLQRCLVLRQGVYGWRLDAGVRAYRGYCLQDAPPEAEPLPAVEAVNAEQGRAELAQLGVVAVFA